MNYKVFTSTSGLELIVKHRKSAVIFEANTEQAAEKKHDFTFEFTSQVFSGLLEYIEEISNKSWSNLISKECDSFGSDYYEYYDRPLDNNGYLRIGKNVLFLERPTTESERLYKFDKRKMQSFIYDFRKLAIPEAS
ncbi:hypothetical protein KFD70_22005 [Bacillus pfraonensis]|uniref:hypothetical protein n=1 Tax=Bacillus pfraonensis TaxID=2830844 RepID=UPI003D6F1007